MSTGLAGVSTEDLKALTAVFRLLTDRTRLNILMILCTGEKNVGTLCQELKLPQPTVSHHLGLLRASKVIENRRSGKQVFYGLNTGVDASQTTLTIALQNYYLRIDRRSADSAPTSDPGRQPNYSNVDQ